MWGIKSLKQVGQLMSGWESPLQAFLQQHLQLDQDGIPQSVLMISYSPAGLWSYMMITVHEWLIYIYYLKLCTTHLLTFILCTKSGLPITIELENNLGWKGPMKVILSNLLLPPLLIDSGCLGSCLVKSWTPAKTFLHLHSADCLKLSMYSLASSLTYCRKWRYRWDCPGFLHPGSSPTHWSIQIVTINWCRHNRQLSEIPTCIAVTISQLLCCEAGKRSVYHLVSSQSIASSTQRPSGDSLDHPGSWRQNALVCAQIQCRYPSTSQTVIV